MIEIHFIVAGASIKIPYGWPSVATPDREALTLRLGGGHRGPTVQVLRVRTLFSVVPSMGPALSTRGYSSVPSLVSPLFEADPSSHARTRISITTHSAAGRLTAARARP